MEGRAKRHPPCRFAPFTWSAGEDQAGADRAVVIGHVEAVPPPVGEPLDALALPAGDLVGVQGLAHAGQGQLRAPRLGPTDGLALAGVLLLGPAPLLGPGL